MVVSFLLIFKFLIGFLENLPPPAFDDLAAGGRLGLALLALLFLIFQRVRNFL